MVEGPLSLGQLAERLERVERSVDLQLLPLIDRIDADVGVVEALAQHFVMPAILLLAGHGHHARLREMLAMLEVELQQGEASEYQLFQVRHWKKLVDEASKAIPGFPPPAGDPTAGDDAE